MQVEKVSHSCTPYDVLTIQILLHLPERLLERRVHGQAENLRSTTLWDQYWAPNFGLLFLLPAGVLVFLGERSTTDMDPPTSGSRDSRSSLDSERSCILLYVPTVLRYLVLCRHSYP